LIELRTRRRRSPGAPDGALLYELSFHTDVAALKGTVFAAIARSFTF
jgi:hypothetical protein